MRSRAQARTPPQSLLGTTEENLVLELWCVAVSCSSFVWVRAKEVLLGVVCAELSSHVSVHNPQVHTEHIETHNNAISIFRISFTFQITPSTHHLHKQQYADHLTVLARELHCLKPGTPVHDIGDSDDSPRHTARIGLVVASAHTPGVPKPLRMGNVAGLSVEALDPFFRESARVFGAASVVECEERCCVWDSLSMDALESILGITKEDTLLVVTDMALCVEVVAKQSAEHHHQHHHKPDLSHGGISLSEGLRFCFLPLDVSNLVSHHSSQHSLTMGSVATFVRTTHRHIANLLQAQRRTTHLALLMRVFCDKCMPEQPASVTHIRDVLGVGVPASTSPTSTSPKPWAPPLSNSVIAHSRHSQRVPRSESPLTKSNPIGSRREHLSKSQQVVNPRRYADAPKRHSVHVVQSSLLGDQPGLRCASHSPAWAAAGTIHDSGDDTSDGVPSPKQPGVRTTQSTPTHTPNFTPRVRSCDEESDTDNAVYASVFSTGISRNEISSSMQSSPISAATASPPVPRYPKRSLEVRKGSIVRDTSYSPLFPKVRRRNSPANLSPLELERPVAECTPPVLSLDSADDFTLTVHKLPNAMLPGTLYHQTQISDTHGGKVSISGKCTVTNNVVSISNLHASSLADGELRLHTTVCCDSLEKPTKTENLVITVSKQTRLPILAALRCQPNGVVRPPDTDNLKLSAEFQVPSGVQIDGIKVMFRACDSRGRAIAIGGNITTESAQDGSQLRLTSRSLPFSVSPLSDGPIQMFCVLSDAFGNRMQSPPALLTKSSSAEVTITARGKLVSLASPNTTSNESDTTNSSSSNTNNNPSPALRTIVRVHHQGTMEDLRHMSLEFEIRDGISAAIHGVVPIIGPNARVLNSQTTSITNGFPGSPKPGAVELETWWEQVVGGLNVDVLDAWVRAVYADKSKGPCFWVALETTQKQIM